jgi:hypothetical protein
MHNLQSKINLGKKLYGDIRVYQEVKLNKDDCMNIIMVLAQWIGGTIGWIKAW